MRVLVPLAAGFEEIEAVTIIDILRRGQIDVTTAGVDGTLITGSHEIKINTDTSIENIDISLFSSIVLPGGMPGSKNLQKSDILNGYIENVITKGGILGAICAAPIVYGAQGILKNKSVTCYPGFEEELLGAKYLEEPVVVDGNIITGRGPGCAIPFALKLVEIYKSIDASDSIKKAMQVYWM